MIMFIIPVYLVFYVTFGVTRDFNFAYTQETEAVEETASRLSKWTPDDVS